MFTNTAFAVTLMLATASGALAGTKTLNSAPSQNGYNAYNPAGAYVGTDPDPNARFELNRDWERERN